MDIYNSTEFVDVHNFEIWITIDFMKFYLKYKTLLQCWIEPQILFGVPYGNLFVILPHDFIQISLFKI